MQTFLPYPSFKESAKCLDNKRLGKQRVECLQILNALKKGEYICDKCREPWHEYIPLKCKCHFSNPIKTPWYNHPATQLWKGYESYLCIYGRIICKEWIRCGFKDSCYDKILNFYKQFKISVDKPKFIGNEKFHLSHMSNLIRKNPSHYRPIFGFDIPDDLEYIWKV